MLSFVWERLVFVNVGVNPSGTKAFQGAISDRAEGLIVFVLTHIFATVMIVYLWKLIFHIVKHCKKEYVLFLVLFALGAVFILVLWPEVLTGIAGFDDNLVTYSCGVRMTPDYWHNAYSSIIYAAMLLVLPVNFSITLIQWAMFVYVLAYMFMRLNAARPKSGYFVFLLFLMPSALYIASNGHRMYHFTILLVLYTAIIAMDIYEQRERTSAEYVKMAVLGAFLSVFRSEGIIAGVLLYGIYLLFTPDRKFVKVVTRIAVFIVFFAAFYLPNSIGARKYYGKDYSMINTYDVLRYVLNDKDCSLEYKGAEDDLAALDAVIPLEVIKSAGTEGYRRYTYNVKGNSDINQSYTDKESGARYMSAYHHIVRHNIKPYLEAQVNSVSVAMGFGNVFEPGEYTGEAVSLDNWYYCGWDNGIEDFYAGKFTKAWYDNELRKDVAATVIGLRDRYIDFCKHRKLYIGGVGLLLLAGVVLFIRGIVAYFKSRNRVKLAIGYMGLTGVISFAAVCVVMPTSASIYFIGSLYLLITLILTLISYECKSTKKLKKTVENE